MTVTTRAQADGRVLVRPDNDLDLTLGKNLPFHKDQNLQPERTVVPAQPKPYLLQGADMLVRTE
jgi:hypothetical protein